MVDTHQKLRNVALTSSEIRDTYSYSLIGIEAP